MCVRHLAPSGIPTNLTVSAVSARTIYITWYPPFYSDQNGVLTKYTLTYEGIERDHLRRTEIISILTGRSHTSLTVTHLEEDTTFNITLKAHTVIGAGPITSMTVHTHESGKKWGNIIK